MKIKVDDKDIIEISEIQKKIICNDIDEEIFEDDMKRRIKHSLMHKYERCLERLKNQWIPKLKERGVSSIPLDDEELAQLIFSQEDYKGRKDREEFISIRRKKHEQPK